MMERQRQRSEGFFAYFVCFLILCLFLIEIDILLFIYYCFCYFVLIFYLYLISLLVFLWGALQGSGWMWRDREMDGTAAHDVKFPKNQQKIP